MKAILIVADGLGVGAAPDAGHYGDVGANTLAHIITTTGASLPTLTAMGATNLLEGYETVPSVGAYGTLRPAGAGKDTTCGHWELAGVTLDTPYATYPNGFPQPLLDRLEAKTGHVLVDAGRISGTEVISQRGQHHLEDPTHPIIVYTSDDSVFQVAAHTLAVPLDELYRICEHAAKMVGQYRIGRVIARPFEGPAGGFVRTYDRHDYVSAPPGTTLLDRVVEDGQEVFSVGKIGDIFAHRNTGVELHTEGNDDGMVQTLHAINTITSGLVMVNLVDFDQLYGHRRDVVGYKDALVHFDRWLGHLLATMDTDTALFISADHGNDPCAEGFNHTRENVPMLAAGATVAQNINIGARNTFADLGATVAEFLDVEPSGGTSFWSQIGKQ